MQWNSGTGTKDSGTGTPRLLEYQCTFGTSTSYRYHTNWYRYQHEITVGFERNFDLGARTRSSFDPHFEITNDDCI